MTDFVILCALEDELPPENNPYRDVTFYTGVGKVNAALAAAHIILFKKPKYVINFGTAGSCDKGLEGLIECGTFFDRDESSNFNSQGTIILDEALATISTGDTFVKESTGDCDLVDMESFAIAEACRRYKTSFKCFKYVTDYVDENSDEDWANNISNGYGLFLEELGKLYEE
jgi:adenosylhomocysteine nucleosidase